VPPARAVKTSSLKGFQLEKSEICDLCIHLSLLLCQPHYTLILKHNLPFGYVASSKKLLPHATALWLRCLTYGWETQRAPSLHLRTPQKETQNDHRDTLNDLKVTQSVNNETRNDHIEVHNDHMETQSDRNQHACVVSTSLCDSLGVLCEMRGSLWRVCAVVPVVAGFVTGIYVPFEFPPDLLQRDPAWGWRAEHSYSKRQLDQVNSDFAIGEVLVLDQFHDLDPTSDLHCLCTITFVHAVKLLLVFYALYELTFVALAHSSGVFVRPRLAVGPAEISTGHAES